MKKRPAVECCPSRLMACLLLALSTTACDWLNGDCAAVEQPVVTGEVGEPPIIGIVTEYSTNQVSMTSELGILSVTGLPDVPDGIALDVPPRGTDVNINAWFDASGYEGVPGFREPDLHLFGETGRLLGHFKLTDLPSGTGLVVLQPRRAAIARHRSQQTPDRALSRWKTMTEGPLCCPQVQPMSCRLKAFAIWPNRWSRSFRPVATRSDVAWGNCSSGAWRNSARPDGRAAGTWSLDRDVTCHSEF